MTLQNNITSALEEMLNRNRMDMILDAHERGVLTDRDLREMQNLIARIENAFRAIEADLKERGAKQK